MGVDHVVQSKIQPLRWEFENLAMKKDEKVTSLHGEVSHRGRPTLRAGQRRKILRALHQCVNCHKICKFGLLLCEP